jgi:hypothetical protein
MLTLADLLRARAVAGTPPTSPAKAAIMVYLLGGPSQLDTYDLKPAAPAEYRGEFQPIRTAVSGIDISELFPRQAALMDKLALVRSLVSQDPGHGDAELVSGYNQVLNQTAHHPSFGAVLSRLRGTSAQPVPPFVSLRRMTFPTPLPIFEYDFEPGYLGPTHRPFMPGGPGLANLRLQPSVSVSQLEDRKTLLKGFDALRRDLDASGSMHALDVFSARAFDVLTSRALADALDLGKEDPRVRDRYGSAAQLLLARRLVEAGVGFVSVAVGDWDTHSKNFEAIRRRLAPQLDGGLSALIEDLYDRGLEKDVVVIAWGEFGRTPLINKDAGRDHWVPVMSAVVAGGGLKMGQVIGSSDARGEYPKDRPYRVPQMLSTLYHALGIDPAQTFPNGSGRPIALLDDREPISELL